MKLVHHKNFAKAYAKLAPKVRSKVDSAICVFQNNPHDRILENHPLKGKLSSRRSLKVTGDIRIIIEQIDNYVIVHLLDVGSHNQVY